MTRTALVVAFLSAACGGDDDAGGNDAAPPDATVPNCPASAPLADEDCSGFVGTTCQYEDCGGQGMITADCTPIMNPPTWSVQTMPCACNGSMCTADTICATYQGGAQIVQCAPHSCGDGPLSCACACDQGTCTEGGSGLPDSQFTCNTCQDQLCP